MFLTTMSSLKPSAIPIAFPGTTNNYRILLYKYDCACQPCKCFFLEKKWKSWMSRHKTDPNRNSYDKNADDFQLSLINSFAKIVSNRHFCNIDKGASVGLFGFLRNCKKIIIIPYLCKQNKLVFCSRSHVYDIFCNATDERTTER
jgi:hypothetical protein